MKASKQKDKFSCMKTRLYTDRFILRPSSPDPSSLDRNCFWSKLLIARPRARPAYPREWRRRGIERCVWSIFIAKSLHPSSLHPSSLIARVAPLPQYREPACLSGTGTSQGFPVIGCGWRPAWTESEEPANAIQRRSGLARGQSADRHAARPRSQLLREDVGLIDAVSTPMSTRTISSGSTTCGSLPIISGTTCPSIATGSGKQHPQSF